MIIDTLRPHCCWLGVDLKVIQKRLGHRDFATTSDACGSVNNETRSGGSEKGSGTGQEPIVRSTLRAIWLLVSAPFSEP
jgi:hypothetical protein